MTSPAADLLNKTLFLLNIDIKFVGNKFWASPAPDGERAERLPCVEPRGEDDDVGVPLLPVRRAHPARGQPVDAAGHQADVRLGEGLQLQ